MRQIQRRVGSSILALAAAVVLSSCAAPEVETVPDDDPIRVGSGVQQAATIEQILENPGTWIGKKVTVAGEVNDVVGPRVFTIGGEEFAGHELPVIARGALPQIPDRPEDEAVVDDDVVLVTGEIRSLVIRDLEQEVGMDLDDEELYAFAGKPVLVVDNALISPRATAIAPGGTNRAQRLMEPEPLSLVVIVQDPRSESYIGRRVRLSNVKVLDMLGDETFWVGSGANQKLFVYLGEEPTPGTPIEGKIDVDKGDTVDLVGEVRRMPQFTSEQKRIWGLRDEDMGEIRKERIYLFAEQASK